MKTMNMVKTVLLTGALLAVSLASADRYPATKTFEVKAQSVRLPVSESGTITLRECDDCDYHSIRVTPQTLYRIDDERMSLAEFRDSLNELKRHGTVGVNVRRDEASQTVAIVFVVSL